MAQKIRILPDNKKNWVIFGDYTMLNFYRYEPGTDAKGQMWHTFYFKYEEELQNAYGNRIDPGDIVEDTETSIKYVKRTFSDAVVGPPRKDEHGTFFFVLLDFAGSDTEMSKKFGIDIASIKTYERLIEQWKNRYYALKEKVDDLDTVRDVEQEQVMTRIEKMMSKFGVQQDESESQK